MSCPYCEGKLILSLYYICPRCKVAMTELELGMAIRAKEDREVMEKLTGRKVLELEGKQ